MPLIKTAAPEVIVSVDEVLATPPRFAARFELVAAVLASNSPRGCKVCPLLVTDGEPSRKPTDGPDPKSMGVPLNVMGAHTRSDEAVNDTCSYVELLHTVSRLHTRSDVGVEAMRWYWLELHCTKAWQDRSEEAVGARV